MNTNVSILTKLFIVQVIGVMGKYMERFPSLKSSLLNCMGQTYASLPVQKAAIQAFRLMEMNSEVNQLLLRFTAFRLFHSFQFLNDASVTQIKSV